MELMLLVLCLTMVAADGPIEVNPDRAGGGKPAEIAGTDLTMSFCVAHGKECPGEDISKAKFAPATSECLRRCGRKKECLNAFYDSGKVCHLRGERCDDKVDAEGLNLHRLKDGESCPLDQPEYFSTIPRYTNRFCVIKGKACAGHDMYKKPQKVSTFLKCLKKCVGVTECLSVDYADGKCALKDYNCEEAELADQADTDNYMRLDATTMTCPGNREVPEETLVPQVTPQPPTEAPAPDEGAPALPENCYANTDCAGFDFKISNEPMEAAACEQACAQDDRCQGWLSYHREGALRCWLKYYKCTAAQRTTLMGATWCEKPGGQDLSCYKHTDCAGYDFDISNHPMDAITCREECEKRSTCRGFLSYHRAGALRCWLKNHACTAAQMTRLDHATWCEKISNNNVCYADTDCAGFDFGISYEPMSPESCAASCEESEHCRGYLTYHLDGAMRCWLKFYACRQDQFTSLPGATWCEKADAPQPQPKCYRNTDCAGFDFGLSNHPMDTIGCMKACLQNADCSGWLSYHRAGTLRCWLKYATCSASQLSVLPGAAWCEKPDHTGPTCYKNTDCAGFDFDISNHPMDAITCKRECDKRAACKGWLSYHRAGALRCWLKNHACTAAQMTRLDGATWCEKV